MAENLDLLDDPLQGVDIRSVALIWGDGEPGPELLLSENCSIFEAVGYLRGALVKLERLCEKTIYFKDDDEDEDDDDDFA